jgi:hypothetical protein
MSSFPTWLFGLLELGRCGMSPRTSEGITRVSRRRCAALANAHGRENPYQSGTPSCRQPRGGRYSLLPTRPSRNPPSRRSRREICTGEGHQHPWAGLRKAQLVDQLPDQPPPTPAKAHQRSGAGWGAALVADRRLDPAALHPDWSPGPAARRRTRTGWRWWRPAQSALPGPRPDVPAQPRRRSCSDRSTATRWRIEANRCTPAGCEATEQAALPTGRPQSGSS